MNKKGFTLIELMIAMVIFAAIIALTLPAFINLLTATKGETSTEEAHIDRISSQELIRLDLEHASFGIGRNEANLPLVWTDPAPSDPTTKSFRINSTLNNTNQSTLGWLMYDCTPVTGGSLSSNLKVDKRQDNTNSNIVLLDSDKNFVAPVTTTTAGNCPVGVEEIYTAYPYDAGGANGCATQWCSYVTYQLSATNTLDNCAAGTRNLLRIVGTGTGSPVINCVADFTVTFDLDTNGDGTIDSIQTTALPTTTTDILSQVKNIDMYVVMQVGRKDEKYNTNPDFFYDDARTLTLSKAIITEDTSNYRWKVVRISGKPMSW